MALWPHVTEVKVLRAKVYTVPAKPGQSGSDRVNPRPRPEDCPCSGGLVRLGSVCVSAPARCPGDGSDSEMAASMFYGRQLAAAALRSRRPQATLRAAAQVSLPCSL